MRCDKCARLSITSDTSRVLWYFGVLLSVVFLATRPTVPATMLPAGAFLVVAHAIGVAAIRVADEPDFAPFNHAGEHTLGIPLALSEWERLEDAELGEYLTHSEIGGVLRQNCGPLHHNKTTRWISGITPASPDFDPTRMRHVSMQSGPCCPNGHTYGWFGAEPDTTEALRRVEVVNGMRTPPFQIRRLLSCLHQVAVAKGPTTTQRRIVVWFQGDSTQHQMYHATFCGLVRIGATVSKCTKTRGHYNHPGCTGAVEGELVGSYEQQSTLVQNGAEIVLVYLGEHVFAQHYDIVIRCRERGDCPTLLIANQGLHVDVQNTFDAHIAQTLELLYTLPPHIRTRVVWRETTIQHFPSSQQSGLYEHLLPNGDTNASRCVERVNLTSASALFRQHHTHETLMRLAREHHVAPLPYISLDGVEANAGGTYANCIYRKKTKTCDLDCTHHLYTPLYWDAVFNRVADAICGHV